MTDNTVRLINRATKLSERVPGPRGEWLIEWVGTAMTAPHEWARGRHWLSKLAVAAMMLPWTFCICAAAFPFLAVFLVIQLWPGDAD